MEKKKIGHNKLQMYFFTILGYGDVVFPHDFVACSPL